MDRKWVAVACAAAVIAPAVVAEFVAAGRCARILREETAITARLDDDIRELRERSVYQRQLAAEVAAGRLALAAAVELLGEANHDRLNWDAGLDQAFPELPDRRARIARVLVAAVEGETAAEPLRAEFEALLGGQ